MRLEELFHAPKHKLTEAPTGGPDQIISTPTGKRVVSVSLADIFMMLGKEIPRVKGPGKNNYIIPEHMLKAKEYTVGDPEKGMLDPKMAAAIANWEAADRIPGAMMDPDTGEIKPWKSNSYLLDLGLATAAGGTEFLDSIARGTAAFGDDVLWFSTFGMYKGDALSDAVDGDVTIVNGKAVEEKSPLDAATSWIESFQSEEFKNEVEITSNAVTSWSDALMFATGNSDASIIGALGIMSGELIPEIVDVSLLASTAWWSGGTVGAAANIALNTLEAGGAAAREIRQQITEAYNTGLLQKQWQWKDLNLPAAKAQLTAEGFVGTEQEFEAAAHQLALDQTVYSAYDHNLYIAAAAGGVIDTIGDRLMYRGPIKETFIGNALGKVILAPTSEMVGEGVEQWLTNIAVISDAGEITTPGAGVINAAYNGLIAGNTSTVVAGTVGTSKAILNSPRRTKLAFGKLKRFFAGGRTDYEELIDITRYDPLTLETYIRDEDGKLIIDKLVKEQEGVVALEDVTDEGAKQRIESGRLNRKERRDGILINGKRYKLEELQKGQRQLDLIRFLQNGTVDTKENLFVSTFQSEEDVRELAELLGIKTGNIRKMPINQVMKELENIGRYDIRIAGRSNLEAPTWNDLSDSQKLEFVNTGKVEFVNDADRGNQTWTRQDVLRSSRNNQESVPAQIANLADNTTARPGIGVASYTATTERGREQDANTIDDFRERVRAQLETDLGREPTEEEIDAQFTEVESTQNALGRTLVVSSDMRSKLGNRASNQYELAQSRMNTRDKVLADAQAKWDEEFGDTHNPQTGVATVNPRYLDAEIAQAQDQVAIDNQEQAEEAMGPRFFPNEKGETPKIEFDINDLPNPGEINDTSTRQMVINNTKLTVSQGNLTADELAGKMNKLEKTYPGITQEVLGENGLENYRQNPDQEKIKIENEYKTLPPPEQPSSVELKPEDAPAEVKVDTTAPTYNQGDTVTYTNSKGETRDAEVVQKLPNGNIQVTLNGATYALTPEQLVTPEVDTTPPNVDTTSGEINVDTTPGEIVLPNYSAGDTLTYRNKKGETRDAEVVQVLPNGNVQVTLNGATFALTPAQINVDTTPPSEPEVDTTPPKAPTIDQTSDETPTLGPVSPPPEQTEPAQLDQPEVDTTQPNVDTTTSEPEVDTTPPEPPAEPVTSIDTTPTLGPVSPPPEPPAEPVQPEQPTIPDDIDSIDSETPVLPPEVQKNIEKPDEPKTDSVPVIPSTVADDPRNEIKPDDIEIPTKPTIEPGTIDTTPPELDTTTPTPPANTDASKKQAQDELTPDLSPDGPNIDQTTQDKDDETDAEKDAETKPTVTPATDPQSEPGRPGGMNQNQQPPGSEIDTSTQTEVPPTVPPVAKPKGKIEVDPTTKNIAQKVDTPFRGKKVPAPPFNILGLGGPSSGDNYAPAFKAVQFRDPLDLAKWKKFG